MSKMHAHWRQWRHHNKDDDEQQATRATMLAWQQQRCLRINNGNYAIMTRVTIAITTMAKMPMHQWQWCHHNKGNNSSLTTSNKGNDASSTMAEMPLHQQWQWLTPSQQWRRCLQKKTCLPWRQLCSLTPRTHAKKVPVHLPLWGGQKVDLESIEWRSIDLHSINSTSTCFWGSIPPNCHSLLSPPPQIVHISWLVPWMCDAALASILHVAGSPLPSHCTPPIVVVQLPLSNCCPKIALALAVPVAIAVAVAIAITITVALAVAVHHCCFNCHCHYHRRHHHHHQHQ